MRQHSALRWAPAVFQPPLCSIFGRWEIAHDFHELLILVFIIVTTPVTLIILIKAALLRDLLRTSKLNVNKLDQNIAITDLVGRQEYPPSENAELVPRRYRAAASLGPSAHASRLRSTENTDPARDDETAPAAT